MKIFNWVWLKKTYDFPKVLDMAPAYYELGEDVKRNGVIVGKMAMPYFENKVYKKYEEAQIIPVLEKDGLTAYYKIIRINRRGSSMDDYAIWDDAKDYQLKLYSIKNEQRRS